MACSKIFSEGGLSELLSDIMQYFRNDFSTLHSCILVNRLWCHLAIPLLWENPFSIVSHTLIISDCIEKWVAAAVNTHNSDFVKFIHKSLIKIFIENKAKLYIFNGIYHNKYFDESILQSSHFIYNIKILYLKINIPLLKFLSSNCESITSLYILSFVKHNTTIEYHLSQLIKSQQNLKKICFIQEFPPILLNSNNRLNTLNTIIFRNIDFKNIHILNEVFEQLNVLESIHIINCYSLDSNFIQQIINLTKPFKLKSLFINRIFESIELLLQKSGDYLENFGLSFELTYCEDSQHLELIKLITNYCTKIKFLELTGFNDNNQIIYSTFNLIETIKQNLNYLTIDINYDYTFGLNNRYTELSSIVLQNLGQILPFKLEYLDLILTMNTNDLEIFLINSQNTFIKKLLFFNITNGTRKKVGQDNILYNIEDYIMDMKRVKYFAFLNQFTDEEEKEELFYMIDKVEEFKLNNIVVQNYNDLKIEFFDLLKE
ncbi:uncharacterized protein OCT59_027414 [Rhizophagus irregularis]|uniref:F-box domain-containing protein n=1 Tax=Rhizophagus irregularis (strain DAOM 197198w) TaxID=1432141 RepID=A0A015IAJ3_RHIIW|nr:hypothetical protein RirG_236520 [Rhizophagus irregularis DAOM 197198w]UZO07116.1 hypothetical protein OCT59_027414 [Rhizophagus irregularis]